MAVCDGGWPLVLGMALLAGAGSAQAVSPADAAADGQPAGAAAPRWYDLTLIAPGLALVIPADWEQVSGGSWQFGTDRRFMIGWSPDGGAGASAMAEGMKANVESKSSASDVGIHLVSTDPDGHFAYDLDGTSTDAAGMEHWQWTRIVPREDESVVLLAVQGDFGDADRIAETREQIAPTLSSLLIAGGGAESFGDFHFRASDVQLSLGALGPWEVIQRLWANPQIKAEAKVSVGFVAAEVTDVSDALLASARAGTRHEVEVKPLESEAGFGPSAPDLVFRIVGHEEDAPEGGPAAIRNERVRWSRHRFIAIPHGTWILRAQVDLRVTHADDFLDNAMVGLDPLFAGWAVTP